MPLSSRVRFLLASLVVLALLAWPRAMSWPGVDALPFVFAVLGAVAAVSVVFRAANAANGRVPLVRKELLLDGLVVLAAVLALGGSRERPVVHSGNRPAQASLGVLAELYDPCERGEASVVCSGVARSVGYVCEDGYTVSVESCPQGSCVTGALTESGTGRGRLSCKETP